MPHFRNIPANMIRHRRPASSGYRWRLISIIVAWLVPAIFWPCGSARAADPPQQRWVDHARVELPGATVAISKPVLIHSRMGYLWFPTLLRLGSGDLVAIMSNYADEQTANSTALVSRSRDGGLTWSPPTEHGYSDSHLERKNGDMVFLPYYLFPRDRGLGAPYQIWARGASSLAWASAPLTIGGLPRPDRSFDEKLGLAGFVFNGQTVKLRDGRHLATLYGSFRGDKRFSLITADSADGTAWTYRSTVADAHCPLVGEEGPSEAAVCRLADGRLMCVFRLHSGRPLGQTFSTDEGRTWSTPVAMRGPHSVQPSLAVMRGGTVLLSSGRPGIYVWVNTSGKADLWEQIDLIAQHNAARPSDRLKYDPTTGQPSSKQGFAGIDGTSSYTETVALDEKHLLCVYDSIPPGWNRDPLPSKADRPNSVWVVRLTVEKSR